MTNRILMIIDVQKGFITPATATIPGIVATRQDQFDMVHVTRFINPPESMHRRLINWHRFAPGSADTALAFAPRADAVIRDKSIYSAAPPAVCRALIVQGVSDVHLCGIATDNCVLKTAVDLFEAGLRPVVIEEACASHGGPEVHDCGLRLLRRFIGADQVI